MADNTDEEHSDNPTNTQSENPSDEINPITDTETITQIQETENMEVHHHPHVEKKSFKEYLLEGVMIFIAVSLGFFAESLRENINKHEREHRLIELLAQDLKNDIIRLDTVCRRNTFKLDNLDTLRKFVFAAIDKELPDSAYKKMYYIEKSFGTGGLPQRFLPAERALSQFEKGDAFNLIRKQNVSDSILVYRSNNETLIAQYQIFMEYYQLKAHEVAQQIFKGSIVDELTDGKTGNWSRILESNKKFTLMTRDQNVLEIYGSKLRDSRSFLYNYGIRLVPAQKARAERLISLIEKEYSLGD